MASIFVMMATRLLRAYVAGPKNALVEQKTGTFSADRSNYAKKFGAPDRNRTCT